MEALLFSAKLRINGDIDKDTLEAYVDEVMDLVELTAIRGAIVSILLSILSTAHQPEEPIFKTWMHIITHLLFRNQLVTLGLKSQPMFGAMSWPLLC